MAGAVIEVRYAGDDPRMREAFDNPHSQVEPQGQPSPTAIDASKAHPSTARESLVSATPSSAEASKPTAGRPIREERASDPLPKARGTEDADGDSRHDRYDRVFQSIDELCQRLDEYIVADHATRAEMKAKKDPAAAPAQSRGKGQSATDSLAEDVAPITSLIRRMIPPELLEIGKWLSKFVDKYAPGVKETGRAIKSTVSRATGRRVATTAVAAAGERAVSKGVQAGAAEAVAAGAGVAAARTAATSAAAGGTSAAGGAAAGVAAAGPAGVAIAGAAIALAGAALAAKALDSGLHAAAKSLEDYSPHLAGVRAQQDVRREMQRLDRADRLGPQLAQFEAARGRLAETGNELLTSILEVLLKFSPLFVGVLDGVNVGVRGIDTLIAQAANVWAQVNDYINDPQQKDNAQAEADLKNSINELSRAWNQFAGNAPNDPFNGMDPQLAAVLQMPFGGNNAPPRPFPPNANFP